MARAKAASNIEDSNTETPVEASTPASESLGTEDLQIQGLPFSYNLRYAEGMPMSKGAAHQLNAVLGENLRNNFAGQIKAAKKKAEEDGGRGLSDEEISALTEEFAKYEASYEFSGARVSRGPVDPVKARARKMARETIESALREKGIKPSELVEGKLDELIDGYLASHPEVTDEAKAQIEKTKAAAAEALGGVDLSSLKAPETAPPAATAA